MIPSFEEAKAASTCQKRVTVCDIYNKEGVLIGRGSNRCNPDGGTCHRLNLVQGKENYDVHSHCNWTHAEIMAIQSLTGDERPYRAVLWGHHFYCDACEEALKNVGVEVFEIIQ